MSQRTQRNRRQLARHISALIALYALPIAGLAIYFLSTGLNAEIARGTRERAGLQQVRSAVLLLHHVVGLAWHNLAANGEAAREFEHELAAIEEQEDVLATSLPRPGAVAQIGRHAPTLDEIRSLWHAARRAPAGSEEQKARRHELVHRLNQFIFHASDRAGLTVSPEAETNAMTDIVASLVPLHLERLLQMHERLGPDLEDGTWDPGSVSAAAVFCQQLEAEDVERIGRSVNAALEGDLRSARALDSFQRDYPQEASAFISSLRRLVAQICPPNGTTAPALPALGFDDRLREAFDVALGFWRDSIDHLDRLIADQIGLARARRDRAVLIAAAFAAMLLPIAFVYFRTFIRPVVQDMVNEAIENQRLAEEARQAADESLRRLRQTQAALDDHCAVLVVNVDRRILAVNERMCRLSGYGRDELLRESPPLIDAAAHPAGYVDGMWSAVAAGGIWHGNLGQRAKGGAQYHVDATVFPICDAAGRPVEFVAIETDITELVRAREAAEDTVRAKSRFLAVMSHEIRTPMNGVLGFANLLAESPLDETQRDYLRTILASGESLLTLINDILDFSKLEADRTELERRPVALRLMIEDTLELLAAQARGKGIELVYWIERGVPEGIIGDETRLRQILLNLVGNALKFTDAGYVEVLVANAPEDGHRRRVDFHVRDTGIGIPTDRRERLFKAFSQVDVSTTRHYGGTGLGLAICKRLVTLLGGEIGVESEPGQGSDFHFTLPVVEADVSDRLDVRTSVARAQIETALRGRRILAVDDMPANLRLLDKILGNYGASVTAADSGEKAQAIFAREPFDLVALDYMMPGMDGVRLGQALRAAAGNRPVPLVLVTSTQPAKTETPPGLFAAIVAKPIRNVQFAAVVAQALAGPARARPEAKPVGTPGTQPGFAIEHPLRIVVVDDNPVNLRVITATLKALGYAPEPFNGATAALERLAAEKFDLILMDVQMPEIDGHEATRRLRSGAAGEMNRRTRVIALTAGALAEERAACLAAGMDDFMAKPVPRQVLLEKLADARAVAV
ncbi:MAG TPA: response regulator [Opitutus sp.]|nr:response regulator [Opitutus sp.]